MAEYRRYGGYKTVEWFRVVWYGTWKEKDPFRQFVLYSSPEKVESTTRFYGVSPLVLWAEKEIRNGDNMGIVCTFWRKF